MTDEEKHMEILNKCKVEIEEVLERYGVELETGPFYDSCWAQLTIYGEETRTNSFKKEVRNFFVLPI